MSSNIPPQTSTPPPKHSPYQLTTIRLNIDECDYSEVYLCSHTPDHIREAYEKSYKKYKLNPLAILTYRYSLILSKETYEKIKNTGFLKDPSNKKEINKYTDSSNVPYSKNEKSVWYCVSGYDVLYNLFIYMCQQEDPTIQFIHVPCEEFFLG